MIPRVLHQIWFGPGGSLPEPFEAFAEGWRELHPRWDYVLWRQCPPDFEVRPLVDEAASYVPARSVGQLRADVLRLELLYRFGGVYVDCDFEPRKPIDALIGGIGAFAAWERQGVWVNNAIMGSIAGTPFLQRLLEGLPASLERHRGRRPNVSTGPQFLTAAYRRSPGALRVFDQELFYPYGWDELDRADEEFPRAFAIHRWNNKAGLASPSSPG